MPARQIVKSMTMDGEDLKKQSRPAPRFTLDSKEEEEMKDIYGQLNLPYMEKETQTTELPTSTDDMANLHGIACETTTTSTLANFFDALFNPPQLEMIKVIETSASEIIFPPTRDEGFEAQCDKLEQVVNRIKAAETRAASKILQAQVIDNFMESKLVQEESEWLVLNSPRKDSLNQEVLTEALTPAVIDDPNFKVRKPPEKYLGSRIRVDRVGANQKDHSFLYSIIRLAMRYAREKDIEKLNAQLENLRLKSYRFRPKDAFAPYYTRDHPKVELGFQGVHKRFLKRKIWKAKYKNDQFLEVSYICSIFIGLPDRDALFELLFNKTSKHFKDAQTCLENLHNYSDVVWAKWKFGNEKPTWKWSSLVKRGRK